MTDAAPALLQIEDLTVQVRTSRGVAEPVQQFSLALQRGETLGLIGESGSGKTLAMLAAMGLLPRNATAHGSIRLNGQELLGMDEPAWCHVRGSRIGMVFQEPMTALNPLQRVGDAVAEPLRLHQGLSAQAARERAIGWLERVGIAQAAERWRDYPHQFSGGQRQRIVLASALACRPDVLIADEPTTALDSTVQAQMLELLQKLVTEEGMAMVLISHDLALVARHVQRISVLYAGRVLEHGDSQAVFSHAAHPYTHALLAARPRLEQPRGVPLVSIDGRLPDLYDLPKGCRFADRCTQMQAICCDGEPPEQIVPADESAHCVRCFFPRRPS
jgi:peptide/nickel transport system ATP-binding protein